MFGAMRRCHRNRLHIGRGELPCMIWHLYLYAKCDPSTCIEVLLKNCFEDAVATRKGWVVTMFVFRWYRVIFHRIFGALHWLSNFHMSSVPGIKWDLGWMILSVSERLFYFVDRSYYPETTYENIFAFAKHRNYHSTIYLQI